MALLQRGDGEAFRALVAPHEEHVYRLAYRLTRNHARAKDVTQDALLLAFRNIGRFRAQSSFGTWLHRITVNAALMKLRSERKHDFALRSPQLGEDGELLEPVDEASLAVDEEASHREAARRAMRAVDDLPEAYRTAFVLYELEGRTIEQAAHALRTTVPAVKMRLSRARRSLRGSLAEPLGAGARSRTRAVRAPSRGEPAVQPAVAS